MNSRLHVVAAASNIRAGSEHVLSAEEFLLLYPQFGGEAVPDGVLQMFIDNANASINENRWHELWKLGVCLHTAHYLTMWLKTLSSPDDSASTIVHKGDSNGSMSSKSVGGVSVSYGNTSGDGDLTGFGSLRDTIYGQQLATLAKTVGKGMMVVR